MLTYRYQLTLEATPDALWPYIADTDRLNRDVGMSPIVHVDTGDLTNGRKTAQQTIRGVFVQQWTEEPFQWVRPVTYKTRRNYTRGLFHTIEQHLDMAETEAGLTQLDYQLSVEPRYGFLRRLIDGSFKKMDFEGVFRHYDTLARKADPAAELDFQPLLRPQAVAFVDGGQARLSQLEGALITSGVPAALAKRLTRYLASSDDLSAATLRPYELADSWHVPRRAVLEACLMATRVGMLDMRWDLLCPLCRGVKASVASLADVTNQVHCEVCRIDYTANFEQSVELTFHPNAQIRDVTDTAYCVGGPETTPHIEIQQRLDSGEVRELTGYLSPGRYRVRTMSLPGQQMFRVRHGKDDRITLRASAIDGWYSAEPTIHPDADITLVNSTDTEQLFVVEHLTWSDQSVTAADVTTQQVFRDLFSSEALRPNEQIAVGTLTFVFTDLRASTQMYQDLGDAPAFGLVMDHFDVLRAAIRAEDGAIVKTIGDAVMAVFRQPEKAVRAMMQAHSDLAQRTDTPVQIRVGVHTGKAIAVTLNERLDYFGTSVNIAARLEGQSDGTDIVLSEATYADPNVQAFLETLPVGQVQSFDAALKGFAAGSFTLWRVRMGASG